MEKLGIIGGMGPAATARLMARIVDLTDVARDQDHLESVVISRPQTPDRTAFLLGLPGAESFVEPLRQTARELELAGCTVLCCPCNTAHARLGQIASGLTARFVSMPASAARLAARSGCDTVGVLATDGTRATGVYDEALREAHCTPLWPDEDLQRQVMSFIYDVVKAGLAPAPGQLESMAARLAQKGADAVILGCTELSVAGCPFCVSGIPVIDALDVLAWRCVQECGAPAFDLAAAISAAVQSERN